MYVIQKKQAFTDTITFQSNGEAEDLTINIKLDLTPELIPKYRTLQIQLLELQKKAAGQDNTGEFVASIGKCIVEMMSLLLGKENTEKIIQFYENDYSQMLTDLFPYIQNVIVPELQKIVKERKQQFKKRA